MIMKADASDVEHGFCILDMWRERTLQFAAVQRREQDPAPPPPGATRAEVHGTCASETPQAAVSISGDNWLAGSQRARTAATALPPPEPPLVCESHGESA